MLKKVARASASELGRPQAMVNRVPASWRDRTAIATSIALHLCVLVAIAGLPRPSFPVDDPDERVLLTTIAHIEHRPAPPPQVAQVERAPARDSTAKETPPPAIHVARTTAHASRRMIVAAERRYAPNAPAVAAVARTDEAPQQSVPAQRTALVAAQPQPTAAPAASTAPAPAPTTAAQHEDGIGNFGETYPASVDPAARGPLFAGLDGSISVRITVDENGRAVAIEFVRGPADASLREELRTRLLAARFIPAACNGLRCGGTLVLRN